MKNRAKSAYNERLYIYMVGGFVATMIVGGFYLLSIIEFEVDRAPGCRNLRTNLTVPCPPGVPGYVPPLPEDVSKNWSMIVSALEQGGERMPEYQTYLKVVEGYP